MEYGFLSVIPALLAIVLAIVTKNIVISLLIAVFAGSTIVCGWNPILGFTEMIHTHMFNALEESTNMQGLFMMVIIAGFVALLTRSGGANAFTSLVTKKVNNRRKCETGIFLGGLIVWFTDTGNSLIVGPIFEALAEKLCVSREKFAYILDCTTSPICSLIPIIGWGVVTMSYIQTELDTAGITEITSMEIFLQAIPLNFYAVLTLFMAGLLAVTQWDYGPMLKAQNRAMQTGKTIRDGGTPMRSENDNNIALPEGKEAKVSTMVVPLAVMLIVLFAYLQSKDFLTTRVAGTDIRTAIASGFLCGTFALIVLCVKDKLFTFTECVNIYTKGCANAMFMCIVLVLAWSLSDVTSTLGTADYLVNVSSGLLKPSMLPLFMFLIGAVMSFATGTSWGTMAILFPLGLPMAISMEASLPLVSAAIIGGGLFGDHCSPISDTTILASIGSSCDHIDHFETQMPYAVTVGVLCAVFFSLAGIYTSPVMLVAAMVVLTVVVFILHRIFVTRYGQVKQPGESIR
ncbi:MAG: hypothetical protein LUE23_09025 [Lachnospiraceae bacterium]|nr:hypothetical protein [Lachnospiraceae bacterium]